MLCEYCETKEIEMKRRPLCKECYRFLHKEDCLNQYPLIEVRSSFVKSLINKYGENIINKYDNIIKSERQGLKDIADEYGFTREYARQIFEKLYGFQYTVIKNNKIIKRKERIFLEKQLKKNPTYKVENYKDGNIKKGAIAEKKVLDICEKLGYEVKPYLEGRAIDLIINNYKVEVKSAYKTTLCNRDTCDETPKYHFCLHESQNDVDFIICYAGQINKFFVIPRVEFPLSGNLYLPEKETTEWKIKNKREPSKYWKYLEAWYLLKRKEDTEIIFTSDIKEGIV